MTFMIPTTGGSGNLQTATSSIISNANAPVNLNALDNNNPRAIYASVRDGKVVLPAANSAGFTPGPVSFPLMMNPGSWPVRLYNSGTLGSEPTLEAILAPGGQYTSQMIANSAGTNNGSTYSAAGGLWNKQCLNGVPFIKTPMPLAPGIAPPQAMTGTFTFNQNGMQAIMWLTGTLGLFVCVDASNNVRGVPFQLSADGLTNQVAGSNTQIQASGGNTLQVPQVMKIDSTRALVSWWDNTNTKNQFVVVTLTPGALPTAPTLAVGTVTDDTGIASGLRILNTVGTLTPDAGAGNFWFTGPTGATNTNRQRAYFLTTSGTTCTVAATLDYDAAHATGNASQVTMGYSPSANKLFIPGNIANGVANLLLLTFSAGNITATWTLGVPPPSGGAVCARIYCIDLAQNIYMWSFDVGAASSATLPYIAKMDLVTPAFLTLEQIGTQASEVDSLGWQQRASVRILDLGDGEQIDFINNGIVYADYKTYYKQGMSGLSTGSPPNVAPSQYFAIASRFEGFGAIANTAGQIAFDPITRRMAFIVQNTLPATPVISVYFAEFPKR